MSDFRVLGKTEIDVGDQNVYKRRIEVGGLGSSNQSDGKLAFSKQM